MVVAIDVDARAVDVTRNTVSASGAERSVDPRLGDCRDVMRERPRGFDVIDLDPCGSPVPFLADAVRAVTPGGLLCIASTEDPALDAARCARLYGGVCFGKDAAHAAGAAAAGEVTLQLLLRVGHPPRRVRIASLHDPERPPTRRWFLPRWSCGCCSAPSRAPRTPPAAARRRC